jgi:serine/threonine protein phosphatase 1
VLAGNHEKKHLKGVLNYAQEITKLQLGEQYADFLAWAENLACYHETEDAIIVHAAFEHDMPLEKQNTEVLCGTTAGERYLEKKYPEGLWTAHYAGEKPIIYGHHVTGDAPEVVGKTFGIDTGCCHGGYLTAIELPSFAVHQVQARQDHWKETQKTWQVPVLQAKNWQAMTWTEIDKTFFCRRRSKNLPAKYPQLERRAFGATARPEGKYRATCRATATNWQNICRASPCLSF